MCVFQYKYNNAKSDKTAQCLNLNSVPELNISLKKTLI